MPKDYMLKVRGGVDTYTKRDGSTGTAGKGALLSEGVAFTVAATQDQTLFQSVIPMKNDTTVKAGAEGDPAFTLRVSGDGGTTDLVAADYIVRRLTPMECERLQGFPDDWTKVPFRGKPADECPDTPRYKACGNSMAVPVMRWIGERIQMVDSMLGGR